jgi:predicted membrane-bound spermidine synthase
VKKKPTPAAAAPEISVALRRFLYLTAAGTGAAIMIVEILGAKMLAPYVGTSYFVWIAQIATTLVALAAGYYLGGRWVDQNSKLDRLYGCILAAALYLCLTVLAVEPVAYACLQFKLALGSLLASVFLFFVPLCLLAMVGPFLVRVLTHSVHVVGGNVGRLTAVSTLGSFAGTILIGYVLIPFLPNSYTMYLTAAVLMVLSAIYFFRWSAKRKGLTAGVILLGLLPGYFGIRQELRPHFKEMEELERRNSEFGMLQVLQEYEGTHRIYLNDFLTQNTYDIIESNSFSMFTYMLHDLAVAYTPRTEDVLCIGLGVGIVPMNFARDGANVDVAEINPAVVQVARDYFGCEPDRLHIVIGDGRYFVNQCRKQYDAIILDAFLGDSSPSHLMTREAFQGMRRILKPDGALVINCFVDFDPGKDFFGASLFKTLSSVFPSVRIHNQHNGGNVFFVASPRPHLRMVRQPGLDHVHPDVKQSVEIAMARTVETNPDHGLILTDDYNPVEYYDAANRESVRKRLAEAARSY